VAAAARNGSTMSAARAIFLPARREENRSRDRCAQVMRRNKTSGAQQPENGCPPEMSSTRFTCTNSCRHQRHVTRHQNNGRNKAMLLSRQNVKPIRTATGTEINLIGSRCRHRQWTVSREWHGTQRFFSRNSLPRKSGNLFQLPSPGSSATPAAAARSVQAG